ncbi:integrator complex subunit 10-like [Amphiura filiformis]|uniref:integrator complex subunit 10-like n=1 Tax=Amphiura filiformis TaxID=82378 RepID=UPI003B213899
MSAPMEVDEPMETEVSESKWLVEKARGCIKSDAYTAKSLLITARTLFPQDLSIQFEAYCIEKAARNVKPSAALLLEMFKHFHEEAILWQELQLVTHALQSEYQDTSAEFLQELFESLPAEAQFDILLRCADHATDTFQKCKLKLLMIKKFPDAIMEHGVVLVESLLEAEKAGDKLGAVNHFRKLLVCEVLPIICATANMQLSAKQYSKWLQRAMEFYMVYLSQPNRRSETSPVSPTGPPDVLTQGSGMGVQDKDGMLANPWKNLHQLLILISERCDWVTKCIPSHERSFRDQWQHISGSHDKNEDFHSSTLRKPTFYATVLLFLRAVFKYACGVDPNQFASMSNATTSQQPAMVLLDDLESKKKSKRHKHKKRKYEAGELRDPGDSDGSDDSPQFPPATVCLNKSLGITQELVDSFQTAVDCWQFLTSHELFEKDLTWLLHRWKAEKWQWLTAFQIDKFIYRGEFGQCLRLLQDEHKSLAQIQPAEENPVMLKTLVQMTAAYFRLGQYSSACEMTLNAMWILPESTSEGASQKRPPSPERQPHSSKHLRQLQLVPCTTSMVMPFFVQLLLLSYKKKTFHHGDTNDSALGHMLVLMQYDWPKEENLFFEVIKRIKKEGEFAYPIFFNYVVCADMLEEFAFLKTEEGGKIKLDLTATPQSSQRQRTITRGVSKGGKEDFKAAMERQMTRCGENVDQLLRKFLTTERDSLLQLLM